MWKRSNREIPFSSCSLFLCSLFILKDCKYNVQQRHSTKQWRAAEQKRWSCWGRGGLCTERSELGLSVSQRSSNHMSTPGATAKCLWWITLVLSDFHGLAFSGQRKVSLNLGKNGEKAFSWVCSMLLQSSLLFGNWCPLVYIKPMSINNFTSSQSTKRHQTYSTRYAWLHCFFFTFQFDTQIHDWSSL